MQKTIKKVKFVGQFKSLKAKGWTFQKLYARNYRQYCKTTDGSKYGGYDVRIWQSGREVTISDFHLLSPIVFEWVASGEYKKDFYQKLRFYTLTINRTSGKPERYVAGRHDAVIAAMNKKDEIGRDLTDKEFGEIVDPIYDNYKKSIFTQIDIDFIKNLLDSGDIEIVEEEVTYQATGQ